MLNLWKCNKLIQSHRLAITIYKYNIFFPEPSQVRKKEVTPSVALLRDESNVDATKIFLYYKDNHEVLVETEYVLMDLGGLLSGIGGIVGALLGWSALDVAAKVCKACQSRKERRSVATNTTQGNNNKSPT